MPYFTSGEVTIHYEEFGTGYPILLIAPGGLKSTIDRWNTSARINPLEEFQGEFRMIAMDQRNAGESKGPFPIEDPWRVYVEDQLNLLDFLGIRNFQLFGCCIGCSFALKMSEVAPKRLDAAVLQQPMGSAPNDDNQEHWKEARKEFVGELIASRPDLNALDGRRFGKAMLEDKNYFIFSVTRDFVRTCKTPLLVLPGSNMPHPHEIGTEIATLAPRATLVDPWQQPLQTHNAAVETVREFMVKHSQDRIQ